MAMADSKPVVSVCIANYNGNDVITNCIESVLAQDCDFNIEIIMHDDASTDSSCEGVINHYPQVKVIKSEVNVGFCVSNNLMAAIARGKYLLLLNNDAELFKDALSSLYSNAKENPDSIIGLPQYNASTGELIDIGCLLDPFLNPIPNLDRERKNVGMVIGACFWIPKKMWDEIGGFPEWFGSIGEDLYVCCVARLKGYNVRTIPYSGFKHHVGHSFGGGKITANNKLATNYKRRLLSEKNKTAVMLMTYPALGLILLAPLHIAFLLIEALFLCIFKYSLLPWNSIYWPCFKNLWIRRSLLAFKREEFKLTKKIGLVSYFSVFLWISYKLKLLLRYGFPKLK